MSLAYLQQEATPLHPDSIWALNWTSRNHIISGCADGHLRVFDPTSTPLQPLQEIAAHSLAISSLSSSSDGSRTLSVSLDGTIALVHPSEGSVVARIDTAREKAASGENELPAYCGALHPESKCWAWSGRSSKVAIRSIEQDEVLGEPAEGDTGNSIGRGVLGGEGKVVDTGKGKFGMDLQFSPDGQSLALASETGHIVILDAETQAVTATYTSHAMAVRTLSWSQDSQWLFSGSDDNRIVLHDVRAGSKSGQAGKGEGAVAIMQGHQGWVLSVASGPDGKLLGSSGADGLVKLWDVGQRTCVSTSSTGNASVWGFAWQPVPSETFAAGKQFVVAGDDKAVTLYRAAGSA